jgi:N-ethylmaleimide reductase
MDVSDPAANFIPLLQAIAPLDLAYLHVLDVGLVDLDTLAMVRANSATPMIVNNMLTANTGRALIEAGRADAVSFGRAFIANPDLVKRLRTGAALAKPDYTKLYTGETQGYTDYPALDAAAG